MSVMGSPTLTISDMNSFGIVIVFIVILMENFPTLFQCALRENLVTNVSTIVLAKITPSVITSLGDAAVPLDGSAQIVRSVSTNDRALIILSEC